MLSDDERKAALGVLARSDAGALASAWQRYGGSPAGIWLMAPQTGLVMVRGRAGGSGPPFNLGEMTVTRASFEAAQGAVGHALVAGRSHEKARIAAMVDALLQTDESAAVREAVLVPLAEAQEADRARRRSETAATKVDFFTFVRGEDS